jgi:hypothetical protein
MPEPELGQCGIRIAIEFKVVRKNKLALKGDSDGTAH